MKLGVNTVLFKGVDVKTAMKAIKLAGYDGVELSAIQGMCEHLVLDAWETEAPLIKAAAKEAGVELLSMEVASLDEDRLTKAFKAAQYLGIPVVNVGPGGKSDVEEDVVNCINTLTERAKLAARLMSTAPFTAPPPPSGPWLKFSWIPLAWIWIPATFTVPVRSLKRLWLRWFPGWDMSISVTARVPDPAPELPPIRPAAVARSTWLVTSRPWWMPVTKAPFVWKSSDPN